MPNPQLQSEIPNYTAPVLTPSRRFTEAWWMFFQALSTNLTAAFVALVTHTAGALALNHLVVGNGGDDLRTITLTDGQIPIGATSDGTVQAATITAGSGISVTNGPHSITIAATGGSGTATPAQASLYGMLRL